MLAEVALPSGPLVHPGLQALSGIKSLTMATTPLLKNLKAPYLLPLGAYNTFPPTLSFSFLSPFQPGLPSLGLPMTHSFQPHYLPPKYQLPPFIPQTNAFPSFKACPKSQSSKKLSLIFPSTPVLSSAFSEVSPAYWELPAKLSSD